jgi:hypothetical protein
VALETEPRTLEELIGEARPKGLSEADVRTLATLSSDRREMLRDRLAVVLAADRSATGSMKDALATATAVGLGQAMAYRLVARWREGKTLADLLPHAAERKRKSSSNAISEPTLNKVRKAILKEASRGATQEEVVRLAAQRLGPDSPSRSTLIRLVRALRSEAALEPVETDSPRFRLDVSGTGFATDVGDGFPGSRVHLCFVIDMRSGLLIITDVCLPALVVPTQFDLLRELAAMPEAGASGDDEMLWVSPESLGDAPRDPDPFREMTGYMERARAIAATGALATDGYELAASAARIGNTINDLILQPRLTGKRSGPAKAGRPLPTLSLRQARILFEGAAERHNSNIADDEVLRATRASAAAAARKLLLRSRSGDQNSADSRSAR